MKPTDRIHSVNPKLLVYFQDRDSPVPSTPVNVVPSQRKTSNVSNSANTSGKNIILKRRIFNLPNIITVEFTILFILAKAKKKRRSGRGNDREKERSASPQEIPIDPDEPTYCLCDQVKMFNFLTLDIVCNHYVFCKGFIW